MKKRPMRKLSRNDERRTGDQLQRKSGFCETQTANIDTVAAGIDDLHRGSICSILSRKPTPSLATSSHASRREQRYFIDNW